MNLYGMPMKGRYEQVEVYPKQEFMRRQALIHGIMENIHSGITDINLFPRAMSQAAVLARISGECREGLIPRSSAALQA